METHVPPQVCVREIMGVLRAACYAAGAVVLARDEERRGQEGEGNDRNGKGRMWM